MELQLTRSEHKTVLDEERALFLAEQADLIDKFGRAAKDRSSRKMSETFERLLHTNGFLRSLERIRDAQVEAEGITRRYTVSSLFLHECFKELTADRDEQFFFL